MCSNGRWIKYSDRQSTEIGGIKRQELRQSETLHCRHQSNIVRSESSDAMGLNECLPHLVQIRSVRKQRKTPPEETHPMPGLGWGHSKAVAAGGRRTGWSGGHRPEFIKVLRDNDQPLSARHQRLNR
jgi:hypothetical protein